MPVKALPKIAIILLNWNNTADTLGCLDSLFNRTYKNFHVFVVDNGSQETEKKKLIAGLKDYGKITPIYLSDNSGFAAGNNAALKLAILEKYDYYLLLNNDTLVAEDFLERLLACANRHPDGGAFGAKIFYSHPPNLLWYAGGEVQSLLARVTQNGFRRKDAPLWSGEKEISFITGCAFLISHKALQKNGYLREEFFSYFEDVEYSIRLKRKGYSLWYCPHAKLWHKVGAGAQTRAYTPYYLYYQTRNRRKAFSSGRSVFFKGYLFALDFFLYFLGRMVYILTSRSKNKRRQLKAVWLGFFHSLVGKMGRERQWEK